MGYSHELYRRTYTAKPKKYIVYFIIITDKGIVKVGRTCRWSYRINNLKQALYEPFTYVTVPCKDGKESLTLEKHLKKVLQERRIVGEWHKCVLEDILPHLTGAFEEYKRYLLPQEKELVLQSPSFSVEF